MANTLITIRCVRAVVRSPPNEQSATKHALGGPSLRHQSQRSHLGLVSRHRLRSIACGLKMTLPRTMPDERARLRRSLYALGLAGASSGSRLPANRAAKPRASHPTRPGSVRSTRSATGHVNEDHRFMPSGLPGVHSAHPSTQRSVPLESIVIAHPLTR